MASTTSQEVTVSRRKGNGTAPEYGEMGDRLREVRQARGLSLRSLAERLGVSPSLISQVETGRAKPSVSTLYAIATELGISLDDLLFIDARATGSGVDPGTNGGSRSAAESAAPGSSDDGLPDIRLPADPVQRGDARETIRLASGVVWERLTTASIHSVDFLYVTYEVGGASSPDRDFQRHTGLEWGYIMSGRLGVRLGFEEYILEPGDSIAFDSTMPHRLYNAGSEPVHAIWFNLGRRPSATGRRA
jgi:transcriptional regulator with XRE-family HTH domain/mannose-6-phosphate isomerase-like protein (cupin superfamily)